MAQSTKTALLDLAQKLAQERGINGFSFHDLARQMGIRTASIHHHFPTKTDLARELMKRYRLEFIENLQIISSRQKDTHKKIEALIGLFRNTLKSGNRVCLCGMLASEFQTLPRPVQGEVQLFFKDTEKWLEGVLTEGKQSGRFNFKGAAKKIAKTFLATLEGAMIAARTFKDEKRLTDSGKWLLASLSTG